MLNANPALSLYQVQNGASVVHHPPSISSSSFLEPTIRAVRFWRHVGPIVLHYKFTELWFKVAHVNAKVRRETWDELHDLHSQTGLRVILDLRGLFVKIGQVMSSRADFIPRQYIDVFQTLQDSVPPWNHAQIQEIVRDSLKSCQGLQLEEVFDEIGEVLGSASIGQVHKAKLSQKYGGETVAIKVMHPNAEKMFRDDFKVFRTLCKVALPGWDPIIRELELQMMTEFDYSNEANNLICVRNNIAKSPYANKVVVPEPKMDLCSKKLLVMEFLSGKKLASHIEGRVASMFDGDLSMTRKVLKAKQQAMFETNDSESCTNSEKGVLWQLNEILGESHKNLNILNKGVKALQLASLSHDARKKLSLILDVTGHQIFNDGLYNGDPHPGNILVLDCGRLGLIDYGQTRRLTKSERLALAGVVSSLGKSTNSLKSVHEIADAMRKFGFRSRDSNDENTAKFAALYFDSDDEGRKLGYATPQKYLQYLNAIDPMVAVPDAAVFVARTSFLFRGLGALLQQSLHTSQHWRRHALTALERNGDGRPLYNLGMYPIND
ncbi:hypothetical protein HJC23_012620 [Cyclotella cryptica]|uniref:Protein kinase domain-containing protein n=1 Tax=Cyclotella cryptica TaxID=29204 RepID=A0ABD3QLF2_9STRA